MRILAAAVFSFVMAWCLPLSAAQKAAAKKTTPAETSKAKTPAKTTAKAKTTKAKTTKAKTTAKAKKPAAPQQPTVERYTEIQQALVERGYLESADGKWGSGSVAALKKFQEDQGLPVDGKLGALSLTALGLGPRRTGTVEEAIAAGILPGAHTAVEE